MFPSLPIEDKYIRWPGYGLDPSLPSLQGEQDGRTHNKHVTLMIVVSDDTCFTGQGGMDEVTTCTLYSSSQ